MLRWRPIICLVALTVCFAACSEGISRSVLTTVLRIEGRAEAASGENAPFTPLSAASRLGVGAHVRTSEGTVDCQIMPRPQGRLGPCAELGGEKMSLTRARSEPAEGMSNRVAKLRLRRGTGI